MPSTLSTTENQESVWNSTSTVFNTYRSWQKNYVYISLWFIFKYQTSKHTYALMPAVKPAAIHPHSLEMQNTPTQQLKLLHRSPLRSRCHHRGTHSLTRRTGGVPRRTSPPSSERGHAPPRSAWRTFFPPTPPALPPTNRRAPQRGRRDGPGGGRGPTPPPPGRAPPPPPRPPQTSRSPRRAPQPAELPARRDACRGPITAGRRGPSAPYPPDYAWGWRGGGRGRGSGRLELTGSQKRRCGGAAPAPRGAGGGGGLSSGRGRLPPTAPASPAPAPALRRSRFTAGRGEGEGGACSFFFFFLSFFLLFPLLPSPPRAEHTASPQCQSLLHHVRELMPITKAGILPETGKNERRK